MPACVSLHVCLICSDCFLHSLWLSVLVSVSLYTYPADLYFSQYIQVSFCFRFQYYLKIIIPQSNPKHPVSEVSTCLSHSFSPHTVSLSSPAGCSLLPPDCVWMLSWWRDSSQWTSWSRLLPNIILYPLQVHNNAFFFYYYYSVVKHNLKWLDKIASQDHRVFLILDNNCIYHSIHTLMCFYIYIFTKETEPICTALHLL